MISSYLLVHLSLDILCLHVFSKHMHLFLCKDKLHYKEEYWTVHLPCLVSTLNYKTGMGAVGIIQEGVVSELLEHLDTPKWWDGIHAGLLRELAESSLSHFQ